MINLTNTLYKTEFNKTKQYTSNRERLFENRNNCYCFPHCWEGTRDTYFTKNFECFVKNMKWSVLHDTNMAFIWSCCSRSSILGLVNSWITGLLHCPVFSLLKSKLTVCTLFFIRRKHKKGFHCDTIFENCTNDWHISLRSMIILPFISMFVGMKD